MHNAWPPGRLEAHGPPVLLAGAGVPLDGLVHPVRHRRVQGALHLDRRSGREEGGPRRPSAHLVAVAALGGDEPLLGLGELLAVVQHLGRGGSVVICI